MNLALFIYLVDRVDVIVYGPLTFLSYLAIILLGILAVFYKICGGEDAVASYKEKVGKNGYTKESEDFANFYSQLPKKAIMWCCMPLVLIHTSVPDKDTCYAILAAYGVQTAAESEEVKQFAGKSLEVLEKAMDQYLEENN